MGWAPNWVGVSGGVAAPSTSITSIARYPQHLDIFCVGTDHGIYSAWWDISTGWSNWFQVAGGIAARGRPSPSSPAILTTSIFSLWDRTTKSTAPGGTRTEGGPTAGSGFQPYGGAGDFRRGHRPKPQPPGPVRRGIGPQNLQHLVGCQRRMGRELVRCQRRRRRRRNVNHGGDPQPQPYRPFCGRVQSRHLQHLVGCEHRLGKLVSGRGRGSRPEQFGCGRGALSDHMDLFVVDPDHKIASIWWTPTAVGLRTGLWWRAA